MKLALGLQSLFLMLRHADIAVGIEEIARLDAIFRMEPAFDQTSLRRVLESTLIKDAEQQQRFRRIYDTWLETSDRELERARIAVDARLNNVVASAVRLSASTSTRSQSGDHELPAAESSVSSSVDASIQRAREANARVYGSTDIILADFEEGFDDDLFGEPGASIDGKPELPLSSPQDEALAAGSETPHVAEKPRASGGSQRLIWPIVLMGAVLIGLSVWILPAMWSVEESVDNTADAGDGVVRWDAGPADAGMIAFRADFVSHKPVFTVQTQPPPERSYLGYIIVPCVLVLIFWLWARFGRGTWIPDMDGIRSGEERGKMTASRDPPRRSLETLMLDERDEEELVWGVGRFVSEDESRDLDIDRTVRETASAYGRPVLCYRGTAYQREVWLWLDESMDTPVARHLADDLELMLQKSGLPVIRATFWGIPERLRTQSNEIITIDAFDARRDSAAVALLTDGRMMSQADRARNRRGDLHNLLRNLSYWPRITFIDFGSGRLGTLCERHHLRVIKPQDAASAISELTESYERQSTYSALVGDARVWAAACMLTPHPISERRALALRRELAVDASPWLIAQIRERADDDTGGYHFSIAERASSLGWLVEAETLPSGDKMLPRASLLARVVDAWDRVLEDDIRAQKRAVYKQGNVWRDSRFSEHIELEREMVHLWTEPDQSAMALYCRHEADEHGHRQAIRHYLRHLGPRDRYGSGDIIALPWRLSELRRETRVVLSEMDFGGASVPPDNVSMPAPRRIWLALGLCIGLLVGSAAALIEQTDVPEKPEPTFETIPGPDNAYSGKATVGGETWQAVAGMPGQLNRQSMNRGDTVRVEWETYMEPCSTVDAAFELRRCTRDGDSPTDSVRDYWSFAIVVQSYPEQAIEVANELLDSQSVDGVFLVESDDAINGIPMAELSRPLPSGQDDQLLIISDRIPTNLGDYNGRHVIIGVNDTASLIGVTDDLEALSPLGDELPHLTTIAGGGDPNDFRVLGTGLCGERDQLCCKAPSERCSSGLRCDEDSERCVTEDCTGPEDNQCVGERTAKICMDNAWMTFECESSEVCLDGACLPQTCSKNTWQCARQRSLYKRCESRGTGWSQALTCNEGTLCTANQPCEPIERAVIRLLGVNHQGWKRRNSSRVWEYDLTCGVAPQGSSETFHIAAASARHSLDNRTIEIPYTGNSGPIDVTCEYTQLQSKNVRMPKGKLQKKSKSHQWSGAAEKKHRLFLRGFDDIKKVVVHYEIEFVPTGPRQQR